MNYLEWIGLLTHIVVVVGALGFGVLAFMAKAMAS